MRRLIIALAALLLTYPAFGQSTVLQGGAWSAGRAPMYASGGSGGNPIVIDSGSAGGGGTGVGLAEQLLTARGTGTPPYVGQGNGPYGSNWCDYDAPITNATGYHYLCLSPNATGNYGLVSYGAGGVAAPLDLKFNVNGVIGSFSNFLTTPVAIKLPVDVATTVNITLSGEQPIDGVTTSQSRVLVKNQATQSQNGIYISGSGAWTRAADFSAGAGNAVQGTLIHVNGGTLNGNSNWTITTANPITVGTTNLSFGVGAASVASPFTTGDVLCFNNSIGTIGSCGGGPFTGFANPTALVGLTAVNGSATTAMRSDAAPRIDQSITPTWTGLHTFNAGATVNSILTTPVTGKLQCADVDDHGILGSAGPGCLSGLFDQQPNGAAPVWTRVGEVITPTMTNCGPTAGTVGIQERATLYDTNPQILTSLTNVFKTWYHANGAGGSGLDYIGYAESADGINWVCYASNPVINNYSEPRNMIKVGSTYYLYAVNTATGNIDQLTSTTGTSFTVAHTNVISHTGNIYNPYAWREDSTHWYMLYSGAGVSFSFPCNLATSADGVTWTNSGSNPVINDGVVACSPSIYKANSGTYYLWTQSGVSTSNGVSDLILYTSSNLTSWVRANPNNCVFCRLSYDEGPAQPGNGQVADPSMVQVGNQVFMYYTATRDQTTWRDKLAIANMTFEQLITTGDEQPISQPASWGNPYTIGQGEHGRSINMQYVPTQGIIGFNVATNLSNTFYAPASGYTGWVTRFKDDGPSNANTNVSSWFLNAAGSAVFAQGFDMTSGGAIGSYYLGPGKICWNSPGIGTCTNYIDPWSGNGLEVFSGSSLGGVRLGFVRAEEQASVGASSGVSNVWDDSTSHRPMMNYNGGSNQAVVGLVASGSKALATTAIASGACSAAQTATATGTLTTDVVDASFNGDPTAVTGYIPATSGMLTIISYPTADTVNFKVCNNTGGSITPGAITLNWKVTR